MTAKVSHDSLSFLLQAPGNLLVDIFIAFINCLVTFSITMCVGLSILWPSVSQILYSLNVTCLKTANDEVCYCRNG